MWNNSLRRAMQWKFPFDLSLSMGSGDSIDVHAEMEMISSLLIQREFEISK